jgi:hypothetical protein
MNNADKTTTTAGNADKTTTTMSNANRGLSTSEANIWHETNTPWDPESDLPWQDETTIDADTEFTNQDKL